MENFANTLVAGILLLSLFSFIIYLMWSFVSDYLFERRYAEFKRRQRAARARFDKRLRNGDFS